MSEDTTKDMGQKYDTKPTLDTLLEEMRAGFAGVNQRFDEFSSVVERRFDAIEIRLDRMESVIHETKSGFHTLRADFNELRATVREHFKEPA